MASRAVVITVGDELLAGFTLDTNSHWISGRLRERGVRLVARETVPDDPEAIAESVRRNLGTRDADVVLVVGGLGPTPDDRTYEGVARGLGLDLELTEENRTWIERRVRESGYGRELLEDEEGREAILRMARLPTGAEPLENEVGAALGAWIVTELGAVVVLPGVPREMKGMVEQHVLDRLGGGQADAVVEVEVRGEEARWWPVLRRIEKEHGEVRVGSYPQDEKGRIVLRVIGPRAEVDRVAERLRREDPTAGKRPGT